MSSSKSTSSGSGSTSSSGRSTSRTSGTGSSRSSSSKSGSSTRAARRVRRTEKVKTYNIHVTAGKSTPKHSPAAPTRGPRAAGGSSPSSSTRASWANPLENIDLCDQEALYEFCEVGRQFGRHLAVLTDCASAELGLGLRELDGGKWLAFGIDTRMKSRRVVRHLDKASEAFAAAAGQFYAAWMAFEKEFGELLEAAGHKPSASKFEIR